MAPQRKAETITVERATHGLWASWEDSGISGMVDSRARSCFSSAPDGTELPCLWLITASGNRPMYAASAGVRSTETADRKNGCTVAGHAAAAHAAPSLTSTCIRCVWWTVDVYQVTVCGPTHYHAHPNESPSNNPRRIGGKHTAGPWWQGIPSLTGPQREGDHRHSARWKRVGGVGVGRRRTFEVEEAAEAGLEVARAPMARITAPISGIQVVAVVRDMLLCVERAGLHTIGIEIQRTCDEGGRSLVVVGTLGPTVRIYCAAIWYQIRPLWYSLVPNWYCTPS